MVVSLALVITMANLAPLYAKAVDSDAKTTTETVATEKAAPEQLSDEHVSKTALAKTGSESALNDEADPAAIVPEPAIDEEAEEAAEAAEEAPAMVPITEQEDTQEADENSGVIEIASITEKEDAVNETVDDVAQVFQSKPAMAAAEPQKTRININLVNAIAKFGEKEVGENSSENYIEVPDLNGSKLQVAVAANSSYNNAEPFSGLKVKLTNESKAIQVFTYMNNEESNKTEYVEEGIEKKIYSEGESFGIKASDLVEGLTIMMVGLTEEEVSAYEATKSINEVEEPLVRDGSEADSIIKLTDSTNAITYYSSLKDGADFANTVEGGIIEVVKEKVNGVVEINETVDFTKNITLKANGTTFKRADGFTGTLMNITSGVSFKMEDATVDGGAGDNSFAPDFTNTSGINGYVYIGAVGYVGLADTSSAVVSHGALTLDNCVLKNNFHKAGSGGALNMSGGTFDAKDTTISHNLAYCGSAIEASSMNTFNMANCVIERNFATNLSNENSWGNGYGTIRLNSVQDSSFVGCTFKDNTVSRFNGGCVQMNGSNRSLSFDNCLFDTNIIGNDGWIVEVTGSSNLVINMTNSKSINCKGLSTGNQSVGAIMVRYNTKTYVDNCVFEGNDGAISVFFDYGGTGNYWKVTNTDFIGNTGSSIAHLYTSDYDIENCRFIDNNNTSPMWYSGGADGYTTYVKGNFANCSFEGNRGWGILWIRDGIFNLTGCTFDNNDINVVSGENLAYGAIIHYAHKTEKGEAPSELNLADCSFGKTNGTCVYNGDLLTVDGCKFEGNSSTIQGGGIYNYGNATISNSTFIRNTSERVAGAVYNSAAGLISIKDSDFIGNVTESAGGAFYNNNKESTTDITDCKFTDNHAAAFGGFMYINGKLNLANCEFDANITASSAGAIYCGKPAQITNCKFTNNQSNGAGGALYLGGTEETVIADSTFVNNKCVTNGGGIWLRCPTTLTNTVVCNNHADAKGDDIYVSQNAPSGSVVINSTEGFGKLDDTGVNIKAWYYDGMGDPEYVAEDATDTTPRWNVDEEAGPMYFKVHESLTPAPATGLKAAHGTYFVISYDPQAEGLSVPSENVEPYAKATSPVLGDDFVNPGHKFNGLVQGVGV